MLRILIPAGALAAALLLLAACGGESAQDGAPAGGAADAPPAAAGARMPGVTYAEGGEPRGLHHYRKWSARVGQGAQPEGDVAFANLKALGYTTILSVDGSVPDVDAAGKHGLTYVHVPIGYDGITRELGLKISKAVHAASGPTYVHCHHGKHRGPAAAMLARICEDHISNAEAVHGLELSGTGKGYTGLWRDVEAFAAPSAAELATVGDLPSKVLPEGLRASMVKVSERWEFLKASQAEGWTTPKDHPDISPPHEARMLWELMRELGRADEQARAKGEVFLAYLKEAEDGAIELEKALNAGDHEAAAKHYKALETNCSDCHRDYRN